MITRLTKILSKNIEIDNFFKKYLTKKSQKETLERTHENLLTKNAASKREQTIEIDGP